MSERADLMGRSLRATARNRGHADETLDALDRVHALAMSVRSERLDDDHHPAYLHPGRTALVLLHDVGDVDPVVLVVAMLHESEDADLRVPLDRLAEGVGAAAAEAVTSIPLPGDERLVERLVGLGPGVAHAILAERLDQLRHLHLRPDLADRWADVYQEVVDVWLPFSARTNERLARRYAHWVRTFVKRI